MEGALALRSVHTCLLRHTPADSAATHALYTQVGAQTETELKEKKLRVEDALNATKAAVEEGVVIGGGCTLLRLSTRVDAIKDSMADPEQKVGGGACVLRGVCVLRVRGRKRAAAPVHPRGRHQGLHG